MGENKMITSNLEINQPSKHLTLSKNNSYAKNISGNTALNIKLRNINNIEKSKDKDYDTQRTPIREV